MTTDLHTTILQQSTELFSERGYAATSIKQIANAAGCTTAALYYYFPEGKAQILREVVRSFSHDLVQIINVSQTGNSLGDALAGLTHSAAPFLEAAQPATNLYDVLISLAQSAAPSIQVLMHRLNWLTLEMARLPDEERAIINTLFVDAHAAIASAIEKHVHDATQAKMLAWITFCAFVGYEQIFLTLGVQQHVPLSYTEFAHSLANVVTKANP